MKPGEFKDLAEGSKAVMDILFGWLDRREKRKQDAKDRRIAELEAELAQAKASR